LKLSGKCRHSKVRLAPGLLILESIPESKNSTRVYLFGALTGQRKGLKYDPELLYVGAMFHDIGLTDAYRNSLLRFEVDGANTAPDFLRSYGIPGNVNRDDMGRDRAAHHTRNSGAQKGGGA
jgi:hypothetical protein